MSTAPVMPPQARDFNLAMVHKQILHPRISRLLYNPGDEPVEFTMAARTFVIPPSDQMASKEDWLKGMCPHLPGAIEARAWHEAQPYPPGALPGILPLGDFHGHKEVVGTHGTTVYKVVPASEQAEFACGPNGNDGPMSKRGIRLLSGDPEVDLAIIADAQQAWKESIYLADLMLIRSHEQINAKMTELGNPLRPLSERVRRAYNRKLEHDRSGEAARLYECPVCAEQHGSPDSRDRHIVTFHPERAGAMGLGLGTAFDTNGQPIRVNVADRYASGPTGTVQGYREVTRDQKGNVVSEKWVGESHQEAEARISLRSTMQKTAVSEVVEGTLNEVLESIAAMQARLDAQAAELAGFRQAEAAKKQPSRVRRTIEPPPPDEPAAPAAPADEPKEE